MTMGEVLLRSAALANYESEGDKSNLRLLRNLSNVGTLVVME
eukprot:CAMPEP_0170853182 /NCGR_PEP_ID=MMETSP0734-20130129/12352_1 /TAXON_ID=186038 /ORGANISM="Fragilariopsis kerguelensis, Strain L26-C5" /LENGTH=41 /DNA_ID= /DNA_START= /DNA_END= /DNA_ORIENTATION=